MEVTSLWNCRDNSQGGWCREDLRNGTASSMGRELVVVRAPHYVEGANSDFNLRSETRLSPELFSYWNKQTKRQKRGREREKKKFNFLSKKIWIGYSAIAIKRFPIDAGNNILWYSSKNMGLEWGNLCLRHSFPTKKLCVSAYDALFVILQFSRLKKGHCLIFITGLLWGGYIIYKIRVAFEGKRVAQQGMIPCRPKSALFCPLGYSKAFQSFLRLASLAITHGQMIPFMCQDW